MADILLLGKNGQVGSALAAILGERAIACDRREVDLTKTDIPGQLDKAAGSEPITTLINAAAYTAVDKAESEVHIADRINGEAVGEMAAWCKARGITLVHYSTDYVFDGSGQHFRAEDEPTGPLNAYGRSKLLGEQLVSASGARHLIFRTSWVYDANGKNFINTMLRLFNEREEVRVVIDQVGAPTYAPHLASATLTALTNANKAEFPSGIYHLCHRGETNWYEFAQAIFALASRHGSGIKCLSIQPITTNEYPTPAKRPLNSRLSCEKVKQLLGVSLPHWKDGLNECYESIRLHHQGS